MELLNEMGKKAKVAASQLAKLKTDEKNRVLARCADALRDHADTIIAANEKDVEAALQAGIKEALIDRLTLNQKRIEGIAEGLDQLVRLDDPIGEVLYMKKLPNGLTVGQKRVAMGVIGIIYEARPNVTADAFGLCFKASSAVILRGGKEALHSNLAMIRVFQDVLKEEQYNTDFVQYIEDTSRDVATAFMKLNQYVDVLIPRGGAGLIQSVVNNSTIPVIETGTGNCHIFVDESGNLQHAVDIVINAKTQRIGVCNAMETLLVHEKIATTFLPTVCAALQAHKVEIRGDERTNEIVAGIKQATEEDYYTEFLDYILAVKVVASVDEAIQHIQQYSTHHSEAIITENYSNAQQFLEEVDSAAVYVNASTRFTDGFEFGFGAEIGISTQKLHARGPMGLKELTTTKYIVYGNGQVRV